MWPSQISTRILTWAIIIVSVLPLNLAAQVAPSAIEAKKYQGLHRAALQNDADAIRSLIAAGADVEAQDGSGRRPIHVAAFASADEALQALAAASAEMNALEDQDYDVVTIAAVANDPALMSLAIELGNPSDLVTSPYEGTALIAAAHLGHYEVVQRLVDARAPLDHINNLDWTALIEAVILGNGGPDHVETVRILVSAGADIQIADGRGITPLQHALARGFDAIAEIISAAE